MSKPGCRRICKLNRPHDRDECAGYCGCPDYDHDLEMSREPAREADPNHLIFMKHLLMTGRLIHDTYNTKELEKCGMLASDGLTARNLKRLQTSPGVRFFS